MSVFALDSILNTRGGILSGAQVPLTALTGDVINERSVHAYRFVTVNGDR